MGNKLNMLANVLLTMRFERELRKQKLKEADYAITISSAKVFFDTFEFLLRQELAKHEAGLVEVDRKEDVAAFVERYREMAKEVLVSTLIEHGKYRFTKD